MVATPIIEQLQYIEWAIQYNGCHCISCALYISYNMEKHYISHLKLHIYLLIVLNRRARSPSMSMTTSDEVFHCVVSSRKGSFARKPIEH